MALERGNLGLILALPLLGCVTWGKLLNISEPELPIFSNGDKNPSRAAGVFVRNL